MLMKDLFYLTLKIKNKIYKNILFTCAITLAFYYDLLQNYDNLVYLCDGFFKPFLRYF